MITSLTKVVHQKIKKNLKSLMPHVVQIQDCFKKSTNGRIEDGVVCAFSCQWWRIWHFKCLRDTSEYHYVRNPLYLGNFLLSLGVCVVANVYWLVPVLIVGYFSQYLPIIALEEAYLLESCGSIYQAYRAAVPRLLPHLRPYPHPSPHDFSWTRALKSEKRTLTAIACVSRNTG